MSHFGHGLTFREAGALAAKHIWKPRKSAFAAITRGCVLIDRVTPPS